MGTLARVYRGLGFRQNLFIHCGQGLGFGLSGFRFWISDSGFEVMVEDEGKMHRYQIGLDLEV